MKSLAVLAKPAPFPGIKPHTHIVYLNDEATTIEQQPQEQQDPNTGEVIQVMADVEVPKPIGFSSTDHGHSHEVAMSVDEQGQQTWVVMPAADGHTHEIEDYELPKKKKESDEDIVRMVHRLFAAACETESESLSNALESDNFYYGDQWGTAEREYLQESKRACLTINESAKHIDDLVGVQIQQRTDIRYLPVEGGDQRVTDILNVVTKHALEACDFPYEETESFRDQVVTGRGAFNVYVDFSENLEGEIKVERFPWQDYRLGPHAKRDASDREYQIKHKMFSRAKLASMYPKKIDEITATYQRFEEAAAAGSDHVQYAIDNYGKALEGQASFAMPMVVGDMPMVDIAAKDIRVLELWQCVFEVGSVAANAEEDAYINVTGWKPRDLKAIKTIPGFSVIEKPQKRMRVTRVVGGCLLSDEDPADIPGNDFYLIPFYYKKRGDYFWGKIHDVKDAQRELNHRHSQMVDIGNKMISYGWFYEEDTFPNATEEKKFKDTSTTPGFTVKVSDINKRPVATEGVKFPSEAAQLLDSAKLTIRELIATVPEQGGANDSGAKLLTLEKQKLTGNEQTFDALSRAKKKLGKLLLFLIQRYYTPQRIWGLVNNANMRSPVEIGGQPLDQFTEEEILELLENADLTKQDVMVSESSYSPTERTAIYMMLTEQTNQGAQIPPEVTLEFAPIPEAQKRKVIEAVKANSDAMAQAEQATADAEIEKTLIAQGVIPPAVSERMGIPPQFPAQQQPGSSAEVEQPQQDNQGALAAF